MVIKVIQSKESRLEKETNMEGIMWDDLDTIDVANDKDWKL